jgi:AcrR family transcriptional regulator
MSIKQRRTDSDVVQSRALATRQKILNSALELYATNGYHNTTVDQIAKNAGLSVGVAYRYFGNKKELLLAALEYAFSNIEKLSGTDHEDVFNGNLSQSLAVFEKIHTDYRNLHEELEGLRHTDEDVRRLYDNVMKNAINNIHTSLPDEIRKRPGSLVDLYTVIGIMENYCHLYMHGTLSKKDLKLMREKTLKLTQELLISK